jgi:signal transduction histidine kinase
VNQAAILIVDDDPALLRALPEALRLRMEGVEIETCDSAKRALQMIAARDYDAIVSDIKMPGMDGLALLEEVRKLRPSTPTLLITGHGERDLAVQALRGGAYDFIQKPIERDYFIASLARAVERRRLDREVERQRLALERHARVLDHVGDGVFVVDPDGYVRLWNPAAASITGISAEDALGNRPDEVFLGWSQLALIIPVADAPGTAGEGARTMPVEVGARELWLSFTGVAFADGTVYTFRDLSSERAIDELKDDFVATVSHELRTPLAAVYGAAETLRRQDLPPVSEDRERLLAVIAEESQRLARVVNDILLASHLDSGRLALDVTGVDPVDLARSVIALIQARGDERVTIELVAPAEVPEIAGDGDRLRQVLLNLVENAIKFSPGEARVEIALEAVRDDLLRFTVRDSGLGITAADQRRVFEKFYRADPQLTSGIGGTGLGLYICRELVRRMNGRIWVESEHGRGSTFFVELPAVPTRKPRRELELDAPLA